MRDAYASRAGRIQRAMDGAAETLVSCGQQLNRFYPFVGAERGVANQCRGELYGIDALVEQLEALRCAVAAYTTEIIERSHWP